ncbi:homeodomain-interacting protein kinase 1-like [Echeneis naucrates]|uniref:homeodomain-interacting protein kinase 1-like n=1 Tax=Echeneis naucrates TaxID=173247 RepID=UPI001114625E|nr:homeodomain-interacting protein kinase 1-like [Echeneis naucrates]
MSSEVQVELGDVLQSNTTFYEVLDFKGEGVFGKVAECRNLITEELVAVKIHKKTDDDNVRWEVEMLERIAVLDPDQSNIVRFIDHFKFMDSSCLAFEMLDMSLWDLMMSRQQPLDLHEIRPVTRQLLVAYEALKKIGIMHADLKPDNIMLVNHRHQPFKIKLIDFGLARQTSEVEVGAIMQAESYRAPEATLGLPLSEAVDMWGVGCVMAFLYFATNLLSQQCSYHRTKTMVNLVGLPAKHHMKFGLYSWVYFVCEPRGEWRLRTPEEFEEITGAEPEVHEGYFDCVKNLKDAVMGFPQTTDGVERKDRRTFFDLLRCCLNPNPEKRITPRKALEHSFVTMAHLRDEVAASSYTEAALQYMRVSPLEKPDSSFSGYEADSEDVDIDLERDSDTISNFSCCSCSHSFISECPSSGYEADIQSSSFKPFRKQHVQYCHLTKHHCHHLHSKTFGQPATSDPHKEHLSPSSPTSGIQPNPLPGSSTATSTPPEKEPSSSSQPVASDNNNKISSVDTKLADGTKVSAPSNKKARKGNVFQRINRFFGRARRRVVSVFTLRRSQSNPPT